MNNQTKTTTELSTEYVRLLQLADQATDRKEAINLIHAADRIRMQMCQEQTHPIVYG